MLQNQKFSEMKTFNAKKKVYYKMSRAYSFTYVFNKQLLECTHVPIILGFEGIKINKTWLPPPRETLSLETFPNPSASI